MPDNAAASAGRPARVRQLPSRLKDGNNVAEPEISSHRVPAQTGGDASAPGSSSATTAGDSSAPASQLTPTASNVYVNHGYLLMLYLNINCSHYRSEKSKLPPANPTSQPATKRKAPPAEVQSNVGDGTDSVGASTERDSSSHEGKHGMHIHKLSVLIRH